MLDDAAGDLGGGERGGGQTAAGARVAVRPALDAAEDVVEENRVGAGPAAPQAAQDGGDEKQHEAQPADQEEKHPQVLRQQCETEEMEPPPFEVEQHRRRAVHRQPRQRHVNRDEKRREPPAGRGEPPAHIRRMQHMVRAIRIDGRDGNQVRAFQRCAGDRHGKRVARGGESRSASLVSSCADLAGMGRASDGKRRAPDNTPQKRRVELRYARIYEMTFALTGLQRSEQL